MKNCTPFYFKIAILLALVAVLFAACSSPAGSAEQGSPETSGAAAGETAAQGTAAQGTASQGGAEQPSSSSGAPAQTAPPTPTATPEPLAALVNGKGILLAEYQASLGQYEQAVGMELEAADKERVLDDLVDQALLAQAAHENGFAVTPEALQLRISQLAEQAGGAAALEAWIKEQGYSRQLFETALARAQAAAWMRDRIAAELPRTAEQVHARKILVFTAQEADEIYTQLKAGNDFGNLALATDPLTGGEMGWFPRGYLPSAVLLDEAIFSLQPDGYTQVIETPAGFHIIQLLEREAERPLEPDALLVLQTQAVSDWLAQRRSESSIEILLP